jgi:hypothetical protein
MIANRLLSFKYLLLLIALVFALSAVLLVYLSSSAATATGSTPDFAISMSPGENTGILGPSEQRWFVVTPNQNGDRFQELCLSMFFAAREGSPQSNVNFQLYSAAEISSWQQGHKSAPVNFGAGMSVSRDANPETGERIWRGSVLRDGVYYLAVENASNTSVDYWLYDDEVSAPEMAQPAAAVESAAAPPVAPVDGLGQSPFDALPLPSDRQRGHLLPGEEMWLSFAVDNTPAQFEETALTLIITPDNGQRVWDVGFEIFTAAAVQNWAAGNSSSLNNIGAGSVTQRDSNPLTGERFWSGWVVNNDLYYVRIANGSGEPIDYWLFHGDVYQPVLTP